MQPVKITVTNHVGREVNPYPEGRVVALPFFEREWVPNHQHDEFERNVKSFPCPELANTKPGETVEAELVWQWWNDTWQYRQDSANEPHEGNKKRQIYRLVPKEEKGKHSQLIDSLLKYEIPQISNKTGISIEWLAVWAEIEMFYGDAQKKETREQLLLRLQLLYSLTPPID